MLVVTAMIARPSADIVVLGNGIIGHAVARAIRQRDSTVRLAVVGPLHRSAGASQAAGAMLGCFGEVTKYTFATAAGMAKFNLNLSARALWPAFVEELSEGDDSLYSVGGTHVILNARSGALDSANFEALISALRGHGEEFEEDVEIAGLDPAPDARPLRSVFIPGEGAIDAGQVIARLEHLNQRQGIELIDDRASAIEIRSGQVTGVTFSARPQLACGRVVIALGAFSSPILDQALPGQVQPVFAGSGIAYVAERVVGRGFSSVVRTVTRAGSCGLHVIPLRGHREYVGATNVIFREPETRPHLGVLHFLAGCAMEQLDGASCFSRVDEVRIGNRPVPLDTFPLLGTTSVKGLTVLTGTYRDGFQCAPAIGFLGARTSLDGVSAFDAQFAPMRRPHGATSVDESIREFVYGAVSSAFESGTRLSTFMSHRDLDSVFRPKAEAIYHQIGSDLALGPDILNYLALSRKDHQDVEWVSRYLRGH